ncbi:MAG: ankyrin repeat domain-containing protein [Elusimicrobiota bacterium]|jgi:ankyrin repeat protein|nr:ankyrin repeat domain-containing protein [Elusimicrobiota bacterium]
MSTQEINAGDENKNEISEGRDYPVFSKISLIILAIIGAISLPSIMTQGPVAILYSLMVFVTNGDTFAFILMAVPIIAVTIFVMAVFLAAKKRKSWLSVVFISLVIIVFVIPMAFFFVFGLTAQRTEKEPLIVEAASNCHSNPSSKKQIELLLKRGANVNAIAKSGYTALIKSSSLLGQTCYEIVELLLMSGADANMQDSMSGETALFKATDPTMVEILLKYGADPNIRMTDGYKETALITFTRNNRQKKIIELLIKYGANVNAKDSHDNTALTFALINNNKEVAEILRQAGAKEKKTQKELDAEAASENASLWSIKEQNIMLMSSECASQSSKKEVESLLKQGANINENKNKFGTTALMQTAAKSASSTNCMEMLKFLLESGADTNIKDQSGETALFYATSRAAVEMLIKHGANPNIKNRIGQTALMWHSAQFPFAEQKYIIEMLIEAGTKKNEKDKSGNTALSLALKNNNQEIAEILKQAGAK